MRPRRVPGGVTRAAALGALLSCVQPAAASADMLDELRGRWAASPSGPSAMEWVPAEDGFSVTWTPAGGAAAATVHFAPAGRPNVFRGTAEEGRSMVGAMFGDDDPVNPLEGGTLFWARIGEDGVFLYSLAIDDRGGLQIDRYACRVDGDGSLAVSLQRRTAAGAVEPVEQRLQRVSP